MPKPLRTALLPSPLGRGAGGEGRFCVGASVLRSGVPAILGIATEGRVGDNPSLQSSHLMGYHPSYERGPRS